MLIERKGLVEHLRRISCGGLIPDVVLEGPFKCVASSVDGCLFFNTDGLEKIESLPGVEGIGIVDLARIISVLEVAEDEKVNLGIDGNYVVVGATDWRATFVTSSPMTIGSKVNPDMAEKILGLVSAEGWISLRRRFSVYLIGMAAKLNAESVVFAVGPQGTRVTVGDKRVSSVEQQFPEMTAEDEFSMQFPAIHLIPVLKQLGDYTKAQILMNPNDSVVGIREGTYLHVISAEKPEAESGA